MNKKLKPNFTQIPNVFFDEWLGDLGKGELKVLLYVMRRTYGFQKNKDRISLSQLQTGIKNLDQGTKLGRMTLMRAITNLEEIGMLKVDRENMTNMYSLNLDYVGSTKTELVPKRYQTSTKTILEVVPKQNTQKKEKESIQKKEENSLNFLKEIPEEQLSKLTKKYKVGISQVTLKGEQLYNYVVQTGKEKKYKNFKALLENALLKDFGKRERDILNY